MRVARCCAWPSVWGRRVARLNPLLLLALILCALGVVTSQHNARKLYMELQREQDTAQQMDVEWGQLQLEQSTWSVPSRVEKMAAAKLEMVVPKGNQVRFVRVDRVGEAIAQP